MNSVISLVTKKNEPDQDLISLIEDLLAEAKSGELTGLAFAAMYGGISFKSDWAGTASAISMLGAIGMLTYEFSQAVDQIPEENTG